ncbi:MAG: hypothetical protein ACK5O1_04350 [Holosporales bacterium]
MDSVDIKLDVTVACASRSYAERLQRFFTKPTVIGEVVSDGALAAFLSYGETLSQELPPLKEQLGRIRFRRHIAPIDLVDIVNASDSIEKEQHDFLVTLLQRTDTHNQVTTRLLHLLE